MVLNYKFQLVWPIKPVLIVIEVWGPRSLRRKPFQRGFSSAAFAVVVALGATCGVANYISSQPETTIAHVSQSNDLLSNFNDMVVVYFYKKIILYIMCKLIIETFKRPRGAKALRNLFTVRLGMADVLLRSINIAKR